MYTQILVQNNVHHIFTSIFMWFYQSWKLTENCTNTIVQYVKTKIGVVCMVFLIFL